MLLTVRRALLTGVHTVTTLKRGEATIDVVEAMSPSPIFALTHFWSTLQMNLLTAKGFCSLYPSLTFRGIGVLTPVLQYATSLPKHHTAHLVQKYQGRGYRFVSRLNPRGQRASVKAVSMSYEAVIDEDARAIRANAERGSGDSHCFTLTFGSPRKCYKTWRDLHTNSWRVGWQLGGMRDGRFYPWNSVTFHQTTGKHIDPWNYLMRVEDNDRTGYDSDDEH